MLTKAAQILGYTFQSEKILSEALRHASSADHRLESNERMEFLGDAVLGYVICEHLFRTYPELLEGELTKIKSAVVSRKICAQISQKLDLTSMLNLGKGMSGRPELPSSVTAAVLESIIAAIYLDGGMDPVKKFILDQFIPYIAEAAESTHQQNYKSVLQHYAQKNLPGNPQYAVLDEKGPDHSKAFEVAVVIDGRRFSSAWANSKKEAEQKAALLALTELGLITHNAEGEDSLHESLHSRYRRSRDRKAGEAAEEKAAEGRTGEATEPGGGAAPPE